MIGWIHTPVPIDVFGPPHPKNCFLSKAFKYLKLYHGMWERDLSIMKVRSAGSFLCLIAGWQYTLRGACPAGAKLG